MNERKQKEKELCISFRKKRKMTERKKKKYYFPCKEEKRNERKKKKINKHIFLKIKEKWMNFLQHLTIKLISRHSDVDVWYS